MIRAFSIFFYVIICTILFLSCNDKKGCDCLKGTGNITTEERTVQPFNKINIEDNINLYISIDTAYSLSVEAGSHLLPEIKTEVTDSCLYLKNENKCNWVRSFKNKINVSIRCKNLKDIYYNKCSGNIYTSDTIYSDDFNVDDFNGSGEINILLVSKNSFFRIHTGPGDIFVKGRSENAYVYSAGNGLIDLGSYASDNVVVSSKSTNSSYVNVKNNLDVHIDYVGDVFYKGDPANIKTEYSGSGKLIKY
jgi:hypothetical protein